MTLVETLMLIKEHSTDNQRLLALLTIQIILIGSEKWQRNLETSTVFSTKATHKRAVKMKNWYGPQLILNLFDTIIYKFDLDNNLYTDNTIIQEAYCDRFGMVQNVINEQ